MQCYWLQLWESADLVVAADLCKNKGMKIIKVSTDSCLQYLYM
jgi:hypothetical protein